LSNAVANSDASNFNKPEVSVSVRDENLKGKPETLSFPSVENLIAETLPFQNADQLVERILASWLKAFSLHECTFIWRECGSLSGRYSSLSNTGDIQHSQFPCSKNIEGLVEDASEKHPHYLNLQWLTLVLDEVPIGQIGFDKFVEIKVPPVWLSSTARLLGTALTWDQTLRENKLKALGEYAAGAGHEINNPLAAINGRTAQLLQQETDPHRKHLLQTIGAQTYRIRDMIGDSMLFARPPEIQLAKLNLSKLIESVVHQFAEEFSTRKLSLWGNREVDVMFMGDETQLSIVIAELLRNSLKAVDEGGRIEIDCHLQEVRNQSHVILRIADNGSGFSEEEREHCFDPFYSGRQAGRGLGFGLSKCWRIVTQHEGRIVLNESHGEMTEFIVSLPIKR
jgi:signal transduction histidine kinase